MRSQQSTHFINITELLGTASTTITPFHSHMNSLNKYTYLHKSVRHKECILMSSIDGNFLYIIFYKYKDKQT